MPPRALITLIIVLGIGVGTGALVFGMNIDTNGQNSAPVTFTAAGAAVLAASVAGFFAQVAGGFRDLDRRDDEL
jgi:hypothetical protein